MLNLIVDHINSLLKTKKSIVIAIDGKSGSGKSTFALKLKELLNASIIKCDDFFLPVSKRTVERLNEIGGNIDYERMKEEVINKLGGTFEYNFYDCNLNKINGTVFVDNFLIVIIEGVYSLHPYFDKYYDLSIFLDIDDENQRNRIIKRNGIMMYERFKNEWIPKENQYFETFKIRESVDYLIKNNEIII